jgi:uncharacterized protein
MSVREGSWQQYDWARESDVMVPMRDGVRLATDMYRPALDGQALSGPFPVLMERTPYGKVRDDLTAMAKYFARRGYVVACRMCEGATTPMVSGTPSPRRGRTARTRSIGSRRN